MAVLVHLAALVAGAVVGLAAVLVHREAFPLGLVLAVAASFALPLRLLPSRHPRAAAAYAGGWLALLGLVVAGRPEGDFAIANDVPGWSLLLAGLLMVAVGLVSLTRSGPPAP